MFLLVLVNVTYSKFPLDGLHNFFVRKMRLLPPALDLLWKFILIPETIKITLNMKISILRMT